MVSGTSAASIGIFVVDPWMFKMANTAKELAAVLRLASSQTVSKLLGCKFNDVGNRASLILSLTFIRLWSLSINTEELH